MDGPQKAFEHLNTYTFTKATLKTAATVYEKLLEKQDASTVKWNL